MQPSILCPTARDLVEVGVLKAPGPPSWTMDDPARRDRVRAALTNSGFALPTGVVNDLGPVPCVGRIWDPADRIPKPHEDAVMSLVQVADLQQAWDAITYFAGAEATILEEVVLGPGILNNLRHP